MLTSKRCQSLFSLAASSVLALTALTAASEKSAGRLPTGKAPLRVLGTPGKWFSCFLEMRLADQRMRQVVDSDALPSERLGLDDLGPPHCRFRQWFAGKAGQARGEEAKTQGDFWRKCPFALGSVWGNWPFNLHGTLMPFGAWRGFLQTVEQG